MAEKKERFVSPLGIAKWAWLNKPKIQKDDRGREKGEPKYQIDLCFDPANPDWKEWCTKVRAEIAAIPATIDDNTGLPMPKQMPIKWEYDENDQKTGRLYVTFKTSDKFKPKIFDARNEVMDGVMIGNGSEVRVNYSPNTYKTFGGGVSFYLNAVQVVKLVKYESGNAKSYGFEPVAGAAQRQPEDDLPF
jgi:hypothetical protein